MVYRLGSEVTKSVADYINRVCIAAVIVELQYNFQGAPRTLFSIAFLNDKDKVWKFLKNQII